jgi:hypothetical protein
VLRVDKVSAEKRILIYRKVADLKGKLALDVVKHQITDGWHPREPKLIMDWARPGRIAVCFLTEGKVALTCLGSFWYEAAPLEAPWWRMTSGRAELSLAYYGSIAKLQRAVPDIVVGKEAIVTAVVHGARQDVWQHGNVGFQKVLRGRDCPLWRIKASLAMPENAMEVGAKDSKWVVGLGAGTAADVRALREELKTGDATRRLEVLDELTQIGRESHAALADLVGLFHDADPLVQVSAARAAVLIGDDRRP